MLMRKSESQNKEETNRKVSKAFLIKGGTEKDRREKCSDLIRGDVFLMYGEYEGGDELAVIFSAHHSDFERMTFEEAKKLAGDKVLDGSSITSTFGNGSRFGVIDVTGLRHMSIDSEVSKLVSDVENKSSQPPLVRLGKFSKQFPQHSDKRRVIYNLAEQQMPKSTIIYNLAEQQCVKPRK